MGEGENHSDDTVIRVRGLPWSATVEDILKFFDGVTIKNGRDGVHLTLSREGRPSGEAYIEVSTEDDVALAEKKHNQHMGRRYIEVFKAKRSEMEWVVKRTGYGSVGGEDEGCVRLRGLPFGCSKEEISQFFNGLEIVPNGIALPTDYQGRHTGEAYVQFINKDVADKALEKHKEKIAHRWEGNTAEEWCCTQVNSIDRVGGRFVGKVSFPLNYMASPVLKSFMQQVQ